MKAKRANTQQSANASAPVQSTQDKQFQNANADSTSQNSSLSQMNLEGPRTN